MFLSDIGHRLANILSYSTFRLQFCPLKALLTCISVHLCWHCPAAPSLCRSTPHPVCTAAGCRLNSCNLLQFQMDKVCGQSTDLFDAELNLKVFPQLFLLMNTEFVKIGNSDYTKSRPTNKNPNFRLNISYLLHSFQIQEVSNVSQHRPHAKDCQW